MTTAMTNDCKHKGKQYKWEVHAEDGLRVKICACGAELESEPLGPSELVQQPDRPPVAKPH